VAAVVLASLAASCTSLRARAYAGVTHTTLQGDVALDSSAGGLDLRANRADVEDEIGLDEREFSPYVRAEVGLPLVDFTASGFNYSQTGGARLQGNHQFGDIPAGSQVSAHLEFTNIKAAAHFDLLDLGVLRLAPGVGVDFIDLDVAVSELSTTNFERIDNEVFVPMVFAQAELGLGLFAATVDVGYMQASLDDARGEFLDVEALLRFSPAPFVEVFAGYRLIDVDVRGNADERRYEADLLLHGWMAGGGIVF
jgi:hypothetical protein